MSIYCIAIWLIVLPSMWAVNAEEGYQKLARNFHNEYRAKHHAPPLDSDEDLNNRAVQCVQYYANTQMDHSCPHKDGAGENLWWSGGQVSNDDAARDATNAWYNEEPKHDYQSDDLSHFTQLVWKASNKFGFGVVRTDKGTFGVALYRPHGNVIGQSQENVARP